MARRRFQAPTPRRRGNWWVLDYWQDDFQDGQLVRKRKQAKLAPENTPRREVDKLAAEFMRPLNQGLQTIGSATGFKEYVEGVYTPTEIPLLAKSTQERSEGVIKNYLIPTFGHLPLRDLTPLTLQKYFSGLGKTKLSHESQDKIKDVLSAILESAKKYELLVKNPVEGLKLARTNRGSRSKPYLTPIQFNNLIGLIAEPYATMVYVAVHTGLRVSELIGLKWKNVHEDSITIDERYCRGDWSAPKSEASNATIAVNKTVIARMHRLKTLTVTMKGGGNGAVHKYKAIKSCGPDDLVFQSVRQGKPMRDNNILRRHIKPAGEIIGTPWVNWRCLRTSHATWLKLAGADVKDAQAQMRHSRASTTLDIYQQFVPESQRKAIDSLSLLTHE
jgi:integrase